MTVIREFAPAKLNLYLHITGRRADGYHDLDSLVAFADIGDEITLSPAEGFSFEIVGPGARALLGENYADNLVVKAAQSLASRVGKKLDIHLRLTKNLPTASGIGGGSSDAAATLRALAKYWGLPIDDPRLVATAAMYGQDVPVCLKIENCYMTSGGVVAAPKLPQASIVLVNPNKPLPTPNVYHEYKEGRDPFSDLRRIKLPIDDVNGLVAELKARKNDLEAPARRLMPEIGAILSFLSELPKCLLARMSGSGATCFGVFKSVEDARQAAVILRSLNPNFWIESGIMNG